MMTVCYGIGVIILVLGLVRGAPWPAMRTLPTLGRMALFWVSALGLAAVLAAVVALVGTASRFDERTDAANGFDTLLTVSRPVAAVCCALALAAHGLTAFRRTGTKG